MKSLILVVLLAAAAATGCSGASPLAPASAPGADGSSVAQAEPVQNTAIVHIPLFIEDSDRRPPAIPATPLFEIRRHNPILRPDRRQLTLAEFNDPVGAASVQCVARGTAVTLRLTHLIPGGLYTIWNVVFKQPGFDPTFANAIGLGALGTSDGSRNIVRASAAGDAAIAAITGPGPLSVFGSIGACALHDEFEWHVVGAYHIDGESHGPSLGPDGTAVEQFGFIFKR